MPDLAALEKPEAERAYRSMSTTSPDPIRVSDLLGQLSAKHGNDAKDLRGAQRQSALMQLGDELRAKHGEELLAMMVAASVRARRNPRPDSPDKNAPR